MVWGVQNYAFDDHDGLADTDLARNGVELSGFANETSKYPAEKEVEAATEKKEDTFFSVPGRKYIIEPAFLMVYLFHISSFSLTSQYTYYAIGEKYNLSAWMDAAAEDSIRNNGSGSGVCGSSEEVRNTTAYELQQKAQAETAMFNFYMDLVNDIPGFVVILFFGTLIDKFGRKPGLIIPLVGIIVRALIYVMQMTLGLPVEFLLVTGIIDALSGGFGTYISSCYAYYADTIPPDQRARRIAIADVVYGLCLAVVSFGMGMAIEHLGFLLPFCFILPGHFINLMYIIFFVPESRNTGAKKKSISPRYVYQSFKVLTKKRPNNGRKLLHIFIVAWFTLGFARGGYKMETIYKLNSPFCWSASMMGTVGSVSAIIMNFVQIFAAVCLIRPLGDINVAMISLTSNIGDQIVTGIASKTWMLLVAPLVGCMAGMQMPMLRAIMSRCVEQGEQGALYSSLAAIDRILGLGSSSFFSFLYAETLYVFKGTIFLVTAGLLSVALSLLTVFKFVSRRQQRLDADNNAKEVKVIEEDKDMEKF